MTSKRSKNSSRSSSGTRPVAILDFDETLINTSAIKARFFALVEKQGLVKTVLKEIDAAFKPFRKENYLELRTSKHASSRRIPALYNGILGKPGEFNFPGAAAFLRDIGRRYDLILLTYGYPPIQRRKIAQSGMKRYFKKIIVTENRSKKAELRALAKHHPGAWLLDDEPYICETARQAGFRTIRVKKGEKGAAYYGRLARKMK